MKKECKGLWIPIEIYENQELSIQDIFLLCEIHSLDNGAGCFAKNEHFCKRMKIKERALQNHLNLLNKEGFIKIALNRKNNTRIIFSNVNLKVYEAGETRRKKMRELTQNNALPDAENCVSIYKEENTIKNTLLDKKTYKKENLENHIPDTRKMVETKSKISSELLGNSEQLEKDFGSTWRYFFDEYKKSGKPAGSKSEAKKLFLKNLKKYKIEEIKQSIHNYVQDCAIKCCGFKYLTSFLSISKNHIEEWKNGSENHQSLLEMKSKPVNIVKNERGFESSKEKLDRNLKEYNNKTSAIFDEVFKNQESEDLRLN